MKQALDILTNKFDRKKPYLHDKWAPILTALVGFGAVCYINWGSRRPVFSGIQQHILAATGAGALGYFIDQKRNQYYADKDAVLRHYVELHPDDFPDQERKKWADVLEEWVPIR